MAEKPLKLMGIPQVALTAPDLETGLAFYQGKLGLPLLFRTPAMAMFACGSTRVLVAGRDQNPKGPDTMLYFQVEDIHTAQASLAREGVQVEGKPHAVGKFQDREVWLATFRDPGGTLHHLISEMPASTAAPTGSSAVARTPQE